MILKRKINLVAAAKKPIRVRRQPDKIYVILNGFIAIMVVGILVATLLLSANVNQIEKESAELREQITVIEQQLASKTGDKAELAELKKYSAAMQQVLEKIDSARWLKAEVFEFLWGSLSGATLDEFKVNSDMFSFTIKADTALNIVGYIETLKASPLFDYVGFSGSIDAQDKEYYSMIVVSTKKG